MATLPDHAIETLCLAGMVTPFDPAMLNPASLDIRLGDTLLIESAQSEELVPYPRHGPRSVVALSDRRAPLSRDAY